MSANKVNFNSDVVRESIAKEFFAFAEIAKENNATYSCDRKHTGTLTGARPQLEIRYTMGRGAGNRFSVYSQENWVSVTIGKNVLSYEDISNAIKDMKGIKRTTTSANGIEQRYTMTAEVCVLLFRDILYKAVSGTEYSARDKEEVKTA